MTEFLERKIYPKLKEGRILVFPTEESARSVAVSYAQSEKKSILAEKCISFDNFSALFYENEKEKRAADNIDRRLFSMWLIDKCSDELEYFYHKNYPEMKDFLPSFIDKMLPDLDEALSGKTRLGKDIFHDLVIIKRYYLEFLEKNSLYQLNYEKINQSLDVSDYYLVSPSAFPKEIKLERKLSDVSLNKIESTPIDGRFSIYSFEKEEIRTLFVRIRSLLDSGVGLEEIAISTAALERLKPYLELEGKLFSVPLQFVPGINVLETLPGTFLSDIYSIFSNGYQIDDMKKFFLNPTMPFIDKSKVREFIAKAVQFSISNAPNIKDDRYALIYLDSAFSYRDFRQSLDRLMNEKKPDKCQSYFQQLLTVLFGKERFVDNKEDNDVFGFIQDNLKTFLERITAISSVGYNIKKPLFPMFISYLKNVQYVPKDKEKGIRVYNFGEGATTPYSYHFLIALNESESKQIVKEASFLSEYERDGIDDEDVTKSLLDTYYSFSDNLYLSASRKTYQGEVLPLVALIDKEVKESYIANDSYHVEDSDNRDSLTLYPIQKEGYENGLKSTLKSNKRGDFKGKPIENAWLSYSTISDYEKCPFKYALINRFGLRNLPTYDISNYDALEIGTRIHSILERFDRFAPNACVDRLEDYFDQEMNTWQEGKRFSYDEESGVESLENMPKGSAVPTDQMIKYLKKQFLENMKKLVSSIREESVYIENGIELRLNSEFPEKGFNLIGRIDKVARDKVTGNLVIYDYKTGKKYKQKEIDDKSLQFYIYKLLLEKNLPDYVEKGKYVFIKDGVFLDGWSENNEQEEKAFNRILTASDGIKNGDWSKTSDKEICKDCEFKQICRRRVVIQ